jgi:hypothetical protein
MCLEMLCGVLSVLRHNAVPAFSVFSFDFIYLIWSIYTRQICFCWFFKKAKKRFSHRHREMCCWILNLKNVKKRFSHPCISQSGTSVITVARGMWREVRQCDN